MDAYAAIPDRPLEVARSGSVKDAWVVRAVLEEIEAAVSSRFAK